MPAATAQSLHLVRSVICDVTGIDGRALDRRTTLASLKLDDGVYSRIWAEAADRMGIPFRRLTSTMPIYAGPSEATRWSLRYLGAVSQSARDALDANTMRAELDTVESVARSLDAGRWVGSGVRSDPQDSPYSLAAFAALTVLSVLPLAFGLIAALDPSCPQCGGIGATGLFGIGLIISGIAIGANVLPGLPAIKDDRHRRAARARIRS